MNFKPILCLFILLFPALQTFAQTASDSVKALPQSRLLRFVEVDTTSTSDRAVLSVYVREQSNGEPILGATTLLQRTNPDGVHGKVTQWDGRCQFKVAPGTYNFRVQLTGMVTFEKANMELLAGRHYEMDIEMAKLGYPVPSAKQQAGRNK